ncbi:terminase small subunit [Skermanella sp. TT6]|uniref:Terminase small subunit n=1 Tax=Skermanella cutis TaxID=2775420 RepID=A0ABX7B0W2_9PROT|nr:terminase small subunit [Skermanella sp. TT6]QQP87965.1 terminase small subunit [Skermanella sp. TT6]
MLDQQSPTSAASAPPVIVLPPRQEAFCQAVACGVGRAEAARRAGYSPKGAKQRGAVLMSQPEIQVRVAQLRAGRLADHQADLEEAAALVRTIMEEALERKSLGLSLRAIELWLKLRGVVQDKRVPHHFLGDRSHPDADLESLDCDPDDEPAQAAPAKPAARHSGSAPVKPTRPAATRNSDLSAFRIVTSPAKPAAAKPVPKRNSDLSAFPTVTSPARAGLFGSTSLSAPVPPFRMPAAAAR